MRGLGNRKAGLLSNVMSVPQSVMKLIENPWVVSVGMLLLFAIICALSLLANGVREPVPRQTVAQTSDLLRSTNQMATLAKQDNNPLMALRHAVAAQIYFKSLRRLLSDDQLRLGHKVDAAAMTERLEELEQEILGRIREQAPELMPEGDFAVQAGWLR